MSFLPVLNFVASQFFLVTLINLLRITYSDIFHDRNVDERIVNLIFGAAIMMFIINFKSYGNFFFIIFLAFVISFLFTWLLKLGSPDNMTINWMVLTTYSYSFASGIFFTITLLTITLLYFVWNKLVLKTMPQPYFPVILLTWVITYTAHYLQL